MNRSFALALLLVAGLARPASAFECLHEVDSLIVEFRIPPFRATDDSAAQDDARRALKAYRASLRAPVSREPGLSPADRRALRELLYAARDAWAASAEDRCFAFLHLAKKVAAKTTQP